MGPLMWHQRTIRGRRQRQINGALDVAPEDNQRKEAETNKWGP
jgi:hypothetical protein